MIGDVALFVISGVSAAGKSTVARLLAGRFERGVCVPGDAVHAMVVSGRLDMRPGKDRCASSCSGTRGRWRWRLST